MKRRKYNSMNEAIADLQSKGTLKFWGRIGNMAEIYYYTYQVEFREYRLYVYEDGTVEVVK